MGKARILCVDDDRGTVTIIAAVLRREGYEVETAYNGDDALKLAKANKPDLIILDIMMPGMDGYQVCHQLRRDATLAEVAVIMLSARGGVDEPTGQAWQFAGKVQDRLKGFDSGAVEFLTKPVKAKELVQRVKAILWMSNIS